MSRVGYPARLMAAVAAFSMIASPTLASAPMAPPSVDPMIALSLLGSTVSRDALCDASLSGSAGLTSTTLVNVASAASASTAQLSSTTAGVGQEPVQGCVLPVRDMVATPQTPGQAPVVASAPSRAIGLPILLIAAGAALLAAVTLFDSDDEDSTDGGLTPISGQ